MKEYEPTREEMDLANKAVGENLDEEGNPKFQSAQGYACALSAIRLMKEASIIGYMCKPEFDYELKINMDGHRVFPSESNLRDNIKCVDECGIVEVGVFLNKIVSAETDWGGPQGKEVW